MDWIPVRTARDIEELLDLCGGFHDSCLAGLSYETGAFVGADGGMRFGSPGAHALVMSFDLQGPPRRAELRLTGLRSLRLTGFTPGCSEEILDATLAFRDGLFHFTAGDAVRAAAERLCFRIFPL